MKLITKIGKFSIILIIIVFVLLFSASFFLKDEVSGIILRSLNKNISTKIEVGSFRLSFLRRFPKASLELKNVFVHSSLNFNQSEFTGLNTDTLLLAKSVSMEFRITDILSGHYNIGTISARTGIINLFTDSTGRINYEISANTGKPGEDESIIDLERINLTDINAVYNNIEAKLKITGLIKKGRLKTRISGEDIDFTAKTELQLNSFELYKNAIKHSLSANIDVKLRSSEEGIRFDKSTLSADNYDLNLEGLISKDNVLDLKISGNNLDIAKITDYLPEKFLKPASGYDPSGIMVVDCTIKGPLTGKLNPHIEIRSSIDNGRVTSGKSRLSFNNISFKGYYSNGSKNIPATSSASFSDLKFRLGAADYKGSVKISDFKRPRTELIMTGRVFPKDLKDFFGITAVSAAGGSVDMDLKLLTNYWPKDSVTLNDIVSLNPEASLVFNSFSFGYDSNSWLFTNVNGDLSISDIYRPHNLSFEYEGQKIKVIEGEFRNLPEWLAGKPVVMTGKANVTFDRLIPGVFLKEQGSGDKSSASKSGVDFPGDLFLDLNFKVDSIRYKTFSSSKISGSLNYKPRLLTFKSLNMNSLDGSISGNGFIAQNSNRSIISKGSFNISSIDVNKAFVTFRNFGQDFIVARNLSGSLSGSVSVLLPMDPSFKPDIKSITAEGKYILVNGALIDFGPVKKLSSFIELSELENINFKTIENDFFIRNNIFYTPQMDVKSSAADLSVNGKHSFDNNYQYHVKMLLSQILSKKRKKSRSNTNEFGIVQDDGLGRTSILLKVENKGDEVKVGYDLKAVSQEVGNSIKSERQALKTILNEEYGLYKNEPAVTRTPQPEKKSRFSISWDETDSVKAVETPDEGNDNKIQNLFRKR